MSFSTPATLRVIDETGNAAGAYPIPHAAPPTWTRDTHRATWSHLGEYVEWRKTKCMPRNYADPAEQMEDINQATLEFIGEVAEMAEMIQMHGSGCFTFGDTRAKFIGEVGDVFFTGSWLMDGWGKNALLETPDLDPGRFLFDGQILDWESRRGMLRSIHESGHYDPSFWAHIYSSAMFVQCQSGLLANSFKKLKYQRRNQRVSDQVNRVAFVLEWAAKFLVLADATVQDALENNVRKLDHRFPAGYQGPGGGNRTGVGA